MGSRHLGRHFQDLVTYELHLFIVFSAFGKQVIRFQRIEIAGTERNTKPSHVNPWIFAKLTSNHGRLVLFGSIAEGFEQIAPRHVVRSSILILLFSKLHMIVSQRGFCHRITPRVRLLMHRRVDEFESQLITGFDQCLNLRSATLIASRFLSITRTPIAIQTRSHRLCQSSRNGGSQLFNWSQYGDDVLASKRLSLAMA